MSLRKTTLLIILFTFLGLIAVLSTTLGKMVLNNFEEAEIQNVQISLQRAQAAVDGEFDFLERLARDWSKWDDTYEFVQDSNQEYIDDNLMDSTLTDLEINLMVFLDLTGQEVFGKAYDLGRDREVAVPEGLLSSILTQRADLFSAENKDPLKGFVSLNGQEDPLMVVIHPVLPTDGDRDAKGLFLVGRYLNDSELLSLGELVQLPMSIISMDEKNPAPDFQAAKQEILNGQDVFTLPLSQNQIGGFTVLNDIFGQPAYLLKIEQSRFLYNNGLKLRDFLFIALAIVGVIFAVMTMLFLEFMVFSRLTLLGKEVNVIRSGDDLARRVSVTRKDELSRLGLNINEMLAALEQAQENRWEIEHRFQILVESIHDLVFTVDFEGQKINLFGFTRKFFNLPAQISFADAKNLPFDQKNLNENREYFMRCLEGEHQVYEWVFDLEPHPVNYRFSLSPIMGRTGKVNGIVGVAHNITELKDLEIRLRRYVSDLLIINEASLLFLSQLDVADISTEICKLAVEKLDVDYAWVGEVSGDHKYVLPLTSYGIKTTEIGGVPLSAAQHKVLENNSADTKLLFTETPFFEEGQQAIYQVSLPLSTESGKYILVNLCGNKKENFSKSRLHIYETFLNLSGLAFRNENLFAQVVEGRKRMEILSQRLVEFQEEERRRIALELHDEIGQILTGLNLLLQLDISELPAQNQQQISDARGLVSDLIKRVRQMSLQLRPSMLDDLGLIPTLIWHFDNYQKQTQINVDFLHSGIEGQRYVSDVEITVYRVVQEALTNVARYAGVKEVQVQLWKEDDMLKLSICDEGKGFDAGSIAQNGKTLGLIGMQHRVNSISGDFSINSAPGKGTVLIVKIPINGKVERRGYGRIDSSG